MEWGTSSSRAQRLGGSSPGPAAAAICLQLLLLLPFHHTLYFYYLHSILKVTQGQIPSSTLDLVIVTYLWPYASPETLDLKPWNTNTYSTLLATTLLALQALDIYLSIYPFSSCSSYSTLCPEPYGLLREPMPGC